MSDIPLAKANLEIEDRGPAGKVARITYDYSRRLNVLNTQGIEKLIHAIRGAGAEPDVRVVVLTGAGERAFIGGADINELANLEPDSARAFITGIHGVCAAVRELEVPIIARIQGYCLGAGLEVAAACDLRVGAEGSVYGMPEVKVGVPSVVEAVLLPQLIGWGKTREMVICGENIDAQEAYRWGLIDRLESAEGLDAQVARWMESILAAGPNAIRLQKSLIRTWETCSIEESIEKSIEVFGRAFETDEPRAMMNRFFERKRGA